MPRYGGLNHGLRRYGGGTPRVERLVDSIGAQRGTAYDSTQPSNVYPENLALARVLDEAWAINQRLANQWDPVRMTEFLSRWEVILNLHPLEGASDVERRASVSLAFARITELGVYQTVVDELTALLGALFVSITTTSTADAREWTPAGWTTDHTTLHDSTGVINFYSTVAHLAILVQQPTGMLDGTFYETVALMNPVLDNLLSGWVTWDWYRIPSGTPGFYLDCGWPGGPGTIPAGVTPVNLDNEALTT